MNVERVLNVLGVGSPRMDDVLFYFFLEKKKKLVESLQVEFVHVRYTCRYEFNSLEVNKI